MICSLTYSQTNESKNSLVSYFSKLLDLNVYFISYTRYSVDSVRFNSILYYDKITKEKKVLKEDEIYLKFITRGTHPPSCSTIRGNVYDFDSIDTTNFGHRDIFNKTW